VNRELIGRPSGEAAVAIRADDHKQVVADLISTPRVAAVINYIGVELVGLSDQSAPYVAGELPAQPF
jgi:hypothetical protein